MKIVFLCTSLAPGRDGVGDYVRQLAAACGALGHACLLVALHDRHLTPGSGLVQTGNEVRLAATLGWTRRAHLLGGLLRDFSPHWVSWQIVPYGFQAKGILPARSFVLADAARPWQNHVMLHELWLGLARADRLRPRLVGALQKRQLLAFLERIGPACLHTTNPAYQLALARQGWPADLLPLFGNIPVAPVTPEAARRELRELAGELPDAPCVGLIFGTLHPQWRPEPTLAWLQPALGRAQRRLVLLFVGHLGAHGTRLVDQLRRSADGVQVVSVGTQPPDRVSRLLQAADFGLATHPWALIAKSGSTAALLEHGLPVLVPRDDWQPRDGAVVGSPDPLLRRLTDLAPSDFPAWLGQRRLPGSQLPVTAARFVDQLSAPAPRGALVA